MFELLIFDLDGTLIDSKRDISSAVNLTLDELGLPRREHEDIFGFIGAGVHNLILKSIREENGHLLERGVDLFWANYKDTALETTRLYPGVRDLLKRFSDRKLSVATNKPFAHTDLILRGLDINRMFMSVQGWKMGVALKPEPEMILAILEETDTAPGDAVMIGDTVSDVLAARTAGVKSCAVGYGFGEKGRLLDNGPDFFADEVLDIAKLIG